jgi:hypothetical protein
MIFHGQMGSAFLAFKRADKKQSPFSPEFEAKLQFFRNLRQKAVTGEHLSPAEILKQARQLGAGPFGHHDGGIAADPL